MHVYICIVYIIQHIRVYIDFHILFIVSFITMIINTVILEPIFTDIVFFSQSLQMSVWKYTHVYTFS